MTSSTSDPHALAIRRAARSFTRALAAEALLAATARLEARLDGDGAGALFALDEALAAAWPQHEAALPRHEVIWTAGAAEGLRLSAFDGAGRVLLRRTYVAGAKRNGGGRV